MAPLEEIILPQAPSFGKAVWNQYTVRLSQATAEGQERHHVQQLMREAGVICMVYYPLPLHLQPVYRHLGYQPGDLPAAETAAHQVLSLPMFPELGLAQQETVVNTLKQALASVRVKAAQYC
jgi:dTDP-4-amino-4,6-dideoxygalactose transaminase